MVTNAQQKEYFCLLRTDDAKADCPESFSPETMVNRNYKGLKFIVLRVFVIGCSGSGKSVFARRLAAITCLPLYYLDMIWHRADRTTISRAEFDRELAEILAGNHWISDGNFQPLGWG